MGVLDTKSTWGCLSPEASSFEFQLSAPTDTIRAERDMLPGPMNPRPPRPVTGNAATVSRDTRGWFLGHFIPGEDNPLRNPDVEIKWFTHAKGETRPEWSPASGVRTLNILIRGRFVLLFPDQEMLLEKEGDFVQFGPGIAHSFRSEEESLVLTVRWLSPLNSLAQTNRKY